VDNSSPDSVIIRFALINQNTTDLSSSNNLPKTLPGVPTLAAFILILGVNQNKGLR